MSAQNESFLNSISKIKIFFYRHNNSIKINRAVHKIFSLNLKFLNFNSIQSYTKTLALPFQNSNSELIFADAVIQPPATIYTFEILRFVAAFITFFGHYAHFFMWQKIDIPTSWFGKINPEVGGLAVPIFFMLSGAIFAHTYGNSIVLKKISFSSFIKKRFARLYPLHFLTLILVMILQEFVLLRHHQYFMYQFNDIKHYVLQVLFISNWTLFENGPSFNGPIWSVSHEVLLYLCFFLFFSMASKAKNKNSFIICCYLFVALLNPPREFSYDSEGAIRNTYIIKSLFTFMTGVFIYQIYRFSLRYQVKDNMIFSGLCIALLASLSSAFDSHGIPYGCWAPITIYLLLILNTYYKLENSPGSHRLFFALGKLTYSSYLLHFPIQLMMFLFSEYALKIDFANKLVFASYLVIVLLVSFFVNNYFELPMKKLILNKKSKN